MSDERDKRWVPDAAPSITQEQVDEILRLAGAVVCNTTNHAMWAKLTPETVRQLCNGWHAWVNYE